MRFVWFWTFWYWSKESFRGGALLRGPLRGIGCHWDEWYRHEASHEDRLAIDDAGRTETAQRQFIAWIRRHWAREAVEGGNRVVPRFVLRQLSRIPPFDAWPTLAAYRKGYGGCGPSAVVLAEGSPGERSDIRAVEGIVLPVDSDSEAPGVIPEGFQADESELTTARAAAGSMLGGKGLAAFLALWAVAGRRPHPPGVAIALRAGWLAVSGAILYLLFGPDPGEWLTPIAGALVAAWVGLVALGVSVTVRQALAARRCGKVLGTQLDRSHAWLRMDDGLTLRGGSAGLAFCLNILLAMYRAGPRGLRHAWLWRCVFQRLQAEGRRWAVTGVVTADARVRPVVLEPKLRACLRNDAVEHILAPHPARAARRLLERHADSSPAPVRQAEPAALFGARRRLGFAAERRRLEYHVCHRVTGAALAIGRLTSPWQLSTSILALAVCTVMALAMPDLGCILLPPPAPAVVGAGSRSSYHLSVPLDTRHPRSFLAVLESKYWSNRRAEVQSYEGAPASVRAEIRLRRLARPATQDMEDGTVWIERRNWFLSREFAAGERVGRYSFAYLNHLGHE